MISSVGEFEKSQANSIANSAYNFLGYLPAPLIYGMVADIMKDWYNAPNSKMPMAILVYSSLVTVGLAFYGLNLRIAFYQELNNAQASVMAEG